LSNIGKWTSERGDEALTGEEGESGDGALFFGSKTVDNDIVGLKSERDFLAMQVNDLGFVAEHPVRTCSYCVPVDFVHSNR